MSGKGGFIQKLKDKWHGMRASEGFRNFMLYLAFVAVAALFWLVLSMNDSVSRTVDMELKIDNVPDSVTFINVPPATFHVTLRDKGTNMLRSGLLAHPQLGLNFREYADDGIFKVRQSDIISSIKNRYGNSAQIISLSLDSLNLHYTTQKGRRVPVVVLSDVTAASGMVVNGAPKALQKSAMIYSYSDITDTITRVYTHPIIRRNLSNTTELEVALQSIPTVRIIPSTVKVEIQVEPLVKKEAMATVLTYNVPEGESLLLFPNRVQVEYFVPMSLFSSDLVPIDVGVDYSDIFMYSGDRLPVTIRSYADYVESPRLLVDSVEYTLVRN